jgi:undecaprenyl-diphosphatase
VRVEKHGFTGANAAIVSVDRSVLGWIVAHRAPLPDQLAAVLSAAGAGGLLWLALAVVVARRRPHPAAGFARPAAAVVSAYLGAGVLARRIQRPRPPSRLRAGTVRRPPQNPSLPSEHAAAAFAGAISVAQLAPGKQTQLLPLAVLVSLSRPWLGVHYLSDTICGAALGTAVAETIAAPGRCAV